MNKWIWLSLPLLLAFTPIRDKHTTLDQVDDEFNNMEDSVQNVQFNVFPGTPTLADLEDHEMVIVSSNGWSTIMWRDNIEIYKVTGSCVTIIR